MRNENTAANVLRKTVPACEAKIKCNRENTAANVLRKTVTACEAKIKSNSEFCKFCEMKNHELNDCFHFGRLTQVEKKDYIIKNQLCCLCLQYNHFGTPYERNMLCKKCQGQHCTPVKDFM